MRRQTRLLIALLAVAVGGHLRPAAAQGTKADYDRAEALPQRWSGKVFLDRLQPAWSEDGSTLRYRRDLPDGRKEWVSVDVATGARQVSDTAPSGAQLPAARRLRGPRPSRSGGGDVTLVFENKLPDAVQLHWVDDGGTWKPYGGVRPGDSREMHTYAGHIWLVLDSAGHQVGCFMAGPGDSRAVVSSDPAPAESDEPSPRRRRREAPANEGPWRAEVTDGNVFLIERATGARHQLTTDGTKEDGYQGPLAFSPDGSRLACRRVKNVPEREVHIVESSPRDQRQPKLKTLRYAKPGDEIDHPRLALFDVAERRAIPVSDELFPTPWSLDDLRWSSDGSHFTALYNQRGHQVLRLLAVDASTGAVRPLIEEKTATFIDYTNKVWMQFLDAGNEVLWMSETRDGWNHLYLFDATTGALKNRVTAGEWPVHRVIRVDEETRQVLFSAHGVWPGQDPYHEHLCRVNLDGSGFVRLTEGDGNHEWTVSPDGKTFVDRWSRVDQPPVTELRRMDDGKLVAELEKGDWSQLLAAGWAPPERFVAKGRDGATDIHGIIIRPSGFDPAKKYPVIEKIYAGPQDFFVPKSFNLMVRDRQIAELGFVWVQIDGMGTNWRSKAFHDVCFKKLQDAGFPDRVAWLKAAAAKHPEMDLSRVGIYGGSAGGQNAMRALIDHGDVYKVAVADCGCHDNRMDKIWWNEQWMSWPIDEAAWDAASNTVQAHRLQGKLLLTWGEMDSNVDPASSMQVVNALVQAGKDFDMLVVPGENHGVGEQPYAARRRMDYFVRNLWNAEPRR